MTVSNVQDIGRAYIKSYLVSKAVTYNFSRLFVNARDPCCKWEELGLYSPIKLPAVICLEGIGACRAIFRPIINIVIDTKLLQVSTRI